MLRVTDEENQLFLCPYDKTHNIRLARMQVHLIRCRRNHTSMDKAQCPFNVTHVVNKVELDLHIKTCPQRQGFEQYCLKDELINETMQNPEASLNESVQSFNVSQMSHLDEAPGSWDTEPDVPSYNPTAYAKAAQVLRQPVGLNPSERRAFRAKERERLQKDC